MEKYTHKIMPDGTIMNLTTNKRYIVTGVKLLSVFGKVDNRAIIHLGPGHMPMRLMRKHIDETEGLLDNIMKMQVTQPPVPKTTVPVQPTSDAPPAVAPSRTLPEFNKNLIDLASELERRAGMLRTIAQDLERLMPEAFGARA